MTITFCQIMTPDGQRWCPIPSVFVKLDDGELKRLFDYYPDEIGFKAEEFIGLTEDEAHNLKFDRDKAYLQSA